MHRHDPIHQGMQKDQRSWPLTLRYLRKPKLRRRSDSGRWITNLEYPMSIRSESRQEEHAEEDIRPQSIGSEHEGLTTIGSSTTAKRIMTEIHPPTP
jgi:hypothetical protein